MVINIGVDVEVTEATIFTKLIKVMELVDQVEQAGTRLSIRVESYSKKSTKHNKHPDAFDYQWSVQIKKEHEPVNFAVLVYMIASPFLLRTVEFLMSSQVVNEYYGCYYSCTTVEREKMQARDCLYIPSIYYDKQEHIYYENYGSFSPARVYGLDVQLQPAY
jgi:hypothetical protein